MTLHEATRDRVWTRSRARRGPPARELGHLARRARRGQRRRPDRACARPAPSSPSAGAAAARPATCCASGDALLRLYRATGDVALLELLRDTVHNLAQYLPRADERRPASGDDAACARRRHRALAGSPGDGVVPADGVFDAIGLLSYTEVPGVYARVDTGFVFVFDHVTARIKERGARAGWSLAVANPTRADATVRILAETAPTPASRCGPGRSWTRRRRRRRRPAASVEVALPRHSPRHVPLFEDSSACC